MSLSQRGLSIHIGRSVSWIRKQGDVVKTTVVRDGLGWKMKNETWQRQRYATGRLMGYSLAANSEENAALITERSGGGKTFPEKGKEIPKPRTDTARTVAEAGTSS